MSAKYQWKEIHCPDDGNLMTLTDKGNYICTNCWKHIPAIAFETKDARPDWIKLKMRKGNEGYFRLILKGRKSREVADGVERFFKTLGYKTMDRQDILLGAIQP